jgi:hypothetical protein
MTALPSGTNATRGTFVPRCGSFLLMPLPRRRSHDLLLRGQLDLRMRVDFFAQDEAKMLLGNGERLLKHQQRARRLAGISTSRHELLHESHLVRYALFKFENMPPGGGRYWHIHAATPRSDLR